MVNSDVDTPLMGISFFPTICIVGLQVFMKCISDGFVTRDYTVE